VVHNLSEIQSIFLGLLSDPKSKHLARESCCLGLAACHGIVKALNHTSTAGETAKVLNHKLLRAFGQTTNYGGSLYQESSAQAAQRRATERSESNNTDPTPDVMEALGAETEVGGAANMGEAALGAYREMAAACVALGRPDILYDLLILSVSNPVWFMTGTRERYGATALLGGGLNQLKLREALKPHIGKLLPKVLRACHDPNKQTRDQMASLLAGLTGGGAETRTAIGRHFTETVDVLLQDSSSKFWRARVGACGALSEIIVGKEWAQLGGGDPILSDEYLYDDSSADVGAAVRLLRIWRTVIRALDDVRGTVRQNGESLGRAVRALTLRLCDPSVRDKSSGEKRNREDESKNIKDASSAAATALRWLVKHGLTQRVAESQGLCVATLVDVIVVARPSILAPSLPELIKSLLLAMSGLEPAALNYLQLRTSNQEGLERARLQLAQNGPLATAVNKCVELLPHAKLETQQAVVVALDSALRLASGFASRAAVADTASIMCNTCPTSFVFAGKVGTANPSVRLMRAFYYATEKERGQGAKDKMTHALGNIAAFCPGSSVRALALRACERYRASTGTHDDPASRRAAAGALRAIVVRSTKQLSDGGNSNVWSQIVLPIAFLGQKDEETKIAVLMKEVWDEGGSTVQENYSFEYGTRVEEAFLPELVKECVRALEDVSWSRRVAGSKSLAELCTLGVLSPLVPNTDRDGTIPFQKGLLPRAKRRAQHCNIAIGASVQLLKKPRLWVGKSTSVTESVRIISSWIPAMADQQDEASQLAWEGDAGDCPWRVLTGVSTDDILIGDRFFDASKMDVDNGEVEEEQQTAKESTEPDASKMEVDDSVVMEDEAPEESTELDADDNGNADLDVMETDMARKSSSGRPREEDGQLATLSFPGFCRFLVEEALPMTISPSLSLSDEYLPYRTAALRGVRYLLTVLPQTSVALRGLIFDLIEQRLRSVIALESTKDKKVPPVLVAASMECIAACLWNDFPLTRAEQLSIQLQTTGGKGQSAWTIREAAALALSQLVLCSETGFLRKPSILSNMISVVTWTWEDRKFWRVRHAGLRLVEAMIQRAGSSSNKKVDIVLEALLPYKEDFQKILRKGLSDAEPRVTSLSSEILVQMSWWP
jgi:proteasome component ECM29